MFRSSLHDMYCQSETKFAFSLHDTTIAHNEISHQFSEFHSYSKPE